MFYLFNAFIFINVFLIPVFMVRVYLVYICHVIYHGVFNIALHIISVPAMLSCGISCDIYIA